MKFEDYISKMPCPEMPKKPTLHSTQPTINEALDYAKRYAQFLEASTRANICRLDFDRDQLRLNKKFKEDVFVVLGINNHPLKENIYDRAMQSGTYWKAEKESHLEGLKALFQGIKDVSEIFYFLENATVKRTMEIAGTMVSPLAHQIVLAIQKEHDRTGGFCIPDMANIVTTIMEEPMTK